MSDVAVTVTSAKSADVLVSVEFTGEVAQVLTTNTSTLDALEKAFTDKTGVAPHVTRDGHTRVMVSGSVDYAHLQSSGSVTGVSSVQLSGQGHQVQASVGLQGVPDLLAALTSGSAGQPDADAVARTMASTTTLQVKVTFPGGLEGAPHVTGVDKSAVRTDSTSVTIERRADRAVQGALIVTGDPAAPANWPGVLAGVLVAGFGGAVVLAKRRDRSDPLTRSRA